MGRPRDILVATCKFGRRGSLPLGMFRPFSMSKGQSVVMAILSDGEPLAAILAIHIPASLKGFFLVHEIETAGHMSGAERETKRISGQDTLQLTTGLPSTGRGDSMGGG